MKTVHSARQGTYVVTYDVASRLQAFRSENLKVPYPHDQLFRNFYRILLEKMRHALPHATIHTIGMDKIRKKIWREVVARVQNPRKHAVVSICPEIADSNPGGDSLILNVNRLFDARGELIGHGARPKSAHLDRQFESLARKISKRSVVLIEDGAFTGGTLRFVLDKMNGLGLEISAVILGFCCVRADAVIRQVFAGELVIVDPLEGLIDWISDHDLIPFLPNCGRVIGEPQQGGFMPVLTRSGESRAYPYILPFGRMEKWASLPLDGARDVSRFCLDTSIEIFGHIESNSSHQIVIGELLRACPKISIPIEIGAHEVLPPLNMPVVGYLRRMREKLD